MAGRHIRQRIPFCLISVLLSMAVTVFCLPLNSKAAGWMSTAGEDDRSYSHLGGGSKFSRTYVSHPPRTSYPGAGNTGNRTLAAILVMTVFGLGATALLVMLCNKMGNKKEQYDSVKGTSY